MSQSSSWDDYYANLGKNQIQADAGIEKKKIKIVAKKSVAPAPVEQIISSQDVAPKEVIQDPEPPTPEAYVSKGIQLPESDTIHVSEKYASKPSVVFHSQQRRSIITKDAPRTWGIQQNRSGDSSYRPNPHTNSGTGQRPAPTGTFQRSAPGGRPWSPANKGNFRKSDAPKKNFKTAKRGTKQKLTFLPKKEDLDTFRRQKSIGGNKQEKNIDDIRQILVDKSGQEVEIGEFLTVKEFSDKIGISLTRIIAELMKNGIIVNINSQIDFDTCYLIAEIFQIKAIRSKNTTSNLTDLIDWNLEALLAEDDPSEKTERPPIISVMGHVDHGKTSILDSIRKSDVAVHEAGGITQKIGAYQVIKNGRSITFLDTPGHEAFALMRSRGAKLTDIIILVVAADEGLKPQTIESISLAKETNTPVVVAINKMDKPGADVDMVKRELSEQELVPDDWGGDTICVPCSAKTGAGIDTLLEMVLLVADMKKFRSHPTRLWVGTVIESHLDPGQWVIANILVNAWVFNRGDAILCGGACGKIRTMKDALWKNVHEATSSTPIQITGLNEVPEGGQIIQVFPSLDLAREKSQAFKLAMSSKSVNKFENASLTNLIGRLKQGTLQYLKVIVKADSNGSLEALKSSLLKITAKDVAVKIIHAGIGAVNESDILMAGTSAAIVVAFNVPMGVNATHILSKSEIEVIADKVIYRIIEKIESIATGMIDIKYDQVLIGEWKALKIFYNGEKMQIVGLSVLSGNIQKGAQLKIIRNDRVAGSGKIETLKEGVYEVNQIEEWKECGIQYKWDTKITVDDKLEFYMTVERK